MERRAIVILATLDTKGAEAAALERLIAGHGLPARVVDTGLGAPDRDGAPGDVTADDVAVAAGTTVRALREAGSREDAMRAMGAGAARLLAAQAAAGALAGVIAVGGNQGTAIAGLALRDLPIGQPKLIVSTVASGDVRPYVGDADIAMLFSVGDLLGGPNAVTGPVLARAAAAICGMARAATPSDAADAPNAPDARDANRSPRVGLTAFGNTHRAATLAMERLRAAGCEVVPFHASGACGSAMERLVDDGVLDAVLDLTTHELLAELYPDDIYAPVRPGRLTAAGRAGLPQVVLPGGLEYFCFGPPESVPPALRERPTHRHNPFNMNVRAGADELHRVGQELAARLNAARGPVAVIVPARGWSEVGAPGGPLHDPAANTAMVDALRAALRPGIDLTTVDAEINDPEVATLAADTLLRLLAGDPPDHAPGETTAREETYAWR